MTFSAWVSRNFPGSKLNLLRLRQDTSLQRPRGQGQFLEYTVITFIRVIFNMAETSSSEAPIEAAPATDLEKLKIAEHTASAEVPPHRSHDPASNLKRSDPFQFGSRYLTEGDNVYEFNAWDHVETDDAYKEYTEQQLEKQRQAPVSDFDKSELLLFSFFLPTPSGDDIEATTHLNILMKSC